MDNKVELGGAWASMANWLTPTILFCFLNITIATIFFSSNFKSRSSSSSKEHNPPLVRPPSLLRRVGSFDFSFFLVPPTHNYQQQQQETGTTPTPTPQPQLQRSPSLLDRVRNLDFSILPQNPAPESTHTPPGLPQSQSQSQPQLTRVPSMLERVKSIKLSLYSSQVTEPVSESTHNPVKRNKKKMEKSASVKPLSSVWSEKEIVDKVEKRRPATTRPVESASLVDEEVDAKADDFINRFRQQLKLQRLDSLLRCRGSGSSSK